MGTEGSAQVSALMWESTSGWLFMEFLLPFPAFHGMSPSFSRILWDVSFLFQYFFEWVKACLAQEVKEEEVSFHLDYSKQELQKVIKKYPGKEVRRTLESLHRTMHKSLSPEENLVPVTGAGWVRHWDGWDSGLHCLWGCRARGRS